jgi:cation transport ATPase
LSKLDAAAGEGAAGATTALLDVSGMMCGGCATRVRSILATHPLVEMAAVNLLAESAAVRLWAPTPPGTGEELAARLTECGFPATARRGWAAAGAGVSVRKWREMAARKEELLLRSRDRVAFALLKSGPDMLEPERSRELTRLSASHPTPCQGT